FKVTFPRIGIKPRFVEASDFAAIRAAIGPRTRALYAETLGNPRLDVIDLEELGKIAKEAGIPFVVDNTATTPALLRPIEHGANIVVHSATKYIGGHGQAIGGAVVDPGKIPPGNREVPPVPPPHPAPPPPPPPGPVRTHPLH